MSRWALCLLFALPFMVWTKPIAGAVPDNPGDTVTLAAALAATEAPHRMVWSL